VSRPTQGPLSRFPVRGCHPLWPAFPDASGTKDNGHWPVPRSLATTDGISRQRLSPPPSRATCAARVLMSVPPATEMFQFTGFASCAYGFSTGYPCGWVAPFGDPGITDRSHLPRAFRSVPRPSSPLSAKASTRCPCFALDHRTAVTGDAHHRRAQGQTPKGQTPKGQTPCLPRTERGAAVSHEDTSLGHIPQQALLAPPQQAKLGFANRARNTLARACPPRSHHNSLFTLQSAPPQSSAAVSQSSPSLGHAPRAPTADPAAAPVVPRGAALPVGGGERIRTDDLLLAKQALSQLSYTPAPGIRRPRTRASEALKKL
jgi:hypothetical protein